MQGYTVIATFVIFSSTPPWDHIEVGSALQNGGLLTNKDFAQSF